MINAEHNRTVSDVRSEEIARLEQIEKDTPASYLGVAIAS